MAAQDNAPPPGLRSMTAPQPLGAYLRELWERRQFTMSLATGSLRAQHLDTTLGNVWHVLNPALLMAVYYVIFGLLLNTSRGVVNFIGFLAIGIFTFTFMQRTVLACASSIPNNLGLIRSLQFPRAVLPISTVIRELSGYGFAAGVMVAVLVLTGEAPQPSWVLAPVLVVLLSMFSTGLGFFVARLTERVRDVANIIPYVFRLLFYVSGIIFSVEAFIDRSALSQLNLDVSPRLMRRLFVLDPFHTYIELMRDVLMTTYEAEFPAEMWFMALVGSPLMFVAGLLYFRGGEKTYGRG